MSLYVDDFKMAGWTKGVDEMWVRLRKKLNLDDPVPMDGATYLGCTQRNVQVPDYMINTKSEIYREHWQVPRVETPSDVPRSKSPGSGDTPHPVRGWSYSMKGHALQCVERYLELSNKGIETLKHVSTPCLDDHLLTEEDESTVGESSLLWT